MDTIFALASAFGKAGVSIIRISGARSEFACSELTRKAFPEHRKATKRQLLALDGSVLDDALILAFHGSASFTGEPVLELHTHGSISITKALLERLSKLDGLRLAEPGEFTRRALENGKLDLTQVEALADLVDAETESQRAQAMRVFDGALGKKVAEWRSKLIRASALIQVTLDFADEEVPDDVSQEVLGLINEVVTDLERQLESFSGGERIRNGFEVAILGPPNAGKSSLLNAIAGRDVAITSEVMGTTRDILEIRLDLEGLPVTLLDTAGLRDASDEIESIGIARAIDRASKADLRIFLSENNKSSDLIEARDGDLHRVSKRDTGSDPATEISAQTGFGISQLLEEIKESLYEQGQVDSLLIRERHRIAISDATTSLLAAAKHVRSGSGQSEFAAEDLREATLSLRSLVGEVGVEDILEDIFKSFCLGK